jgi:hypothetical protein
MRGKMDYKIFNVIREYKEIRLFLQSSTVDNNGVHYLTARAITPAEWDREIDDINKQLEEARSRGHRLLKKLWRKSPGITSIEDAIATLREVDSVREGDHEE